MKKYAESYFWKWADRNLAHKLIKGKTFTFQVSNSKLRSKFVPSAVAWRKLKDFTDKGK